MRKFRTFLAVYSLIVVCVLIAGQSGYSQTSNTWSIAGKMTQARTGAAAVLLSNGKLLITGGSDSSGTPQTSTEIFDPATGQFAAAAPMNVARQNHATITLYTGDVLVTGGLTTGGAYSDTAEIYSAQTGRWTLIQASLGEGIAKQTMATLSDNNVLIIGGESTTGPVLNLLLFKLSDQTITPVGTLLTGRSDAAAAATPDGRVLIAGGTDINGAVLGSTEIFTYSPDTMAGTIATGPNLAYPRTNASATTTYDGVAIIGGSNGSADLGSAEIFSQWTNALRVVNGATPRSGHMAARLPKNGSILAMGGSGGTAVDLLEPWANNLAGAFVPGAPSTVDHADGFAAPGSLGTMLAAGGTGSSASVAELYWFPTISTDQPDYAPGTPVVMTGVGFRPGETVNLYLREYVNQMLVDPPDYSATADGAGSFTFMDYAPTPTDVGARYHLTAVGQTSGFQAQTIFTDSTNTDTAITSNANPSNSGANVTFTATVTAHSGGAAITVGSVQFKTGGTNCGNANSFGSAQTLDPNGKASASKSFSNPPISSGVTVWACYTGTGGSSGTGNSVGSLTQSVNTTVATSTAESSLSIVYGQTATSTVTVTGLAGSGSPTGSISMSVSNGGSASCSSLSAAGSATSTSTCTITYPSASTTAYALTANYTPSGNFGSSQDNTGTLTVTQENPTFSNLTASQSASYGTATVTLSGKLTGTHAALPSGSTITITINNSTTSANITDSAGDFSASVSTSSLGASNTPYSITYNYAATTNFKAASDSSTSLTINKANATIQVTPYTVTYDGQAHSALVGTITGVNNETGSAVGTVDVSHTTHSGANTYAADYWTFTGTANYNNISATTITDTINKANATVTVTPYTTIYDGQSHTALVGTITGVNNETGSTVGTVDVSHTTHTNASTYAADYWTFAGSGNYNNIASTTITDTISKATATITVTPYTTTYDGQTHTAAATVSGVNGETGATVGTVNLSNTSHTSAATYSTDSWSFTGAGNYNDIAATTITDTINKANATVVVTPYIVTYDGQAHTAGVTSITGVNGESGATVGTVNLGNTSHTGAGTYSDSWNFTGTANYNDIASTNITDTINKANATVVVTPYTVIYDGQPHTATATITGVNNETGAIVGTVTLNTTHVNAAVYSSDSWSFTGGANYNNIAPSAVTDTINKADAKVIVTSYTVTYDGQAHTATVTSITGVNGETGAMVGAVSLSTTHTSAGNYASDSWSFTGTANYNNIAATTITDVINRANATVVVTPYTVTYDGQAHTASASITGVSGETGSTVGTVSLNTTHSNAGTYSSDSWSFTGTANYNDISAAAITDIINKANATVVVTPYVATYDGHAHSAIITSITGVNGETGSTVGAVSLNTTHTDAGTYSSDSWSFTGTANYNNIAAATITDVINKANAIVTVTPYTVTYDGQAHAAMVSVAGVNGENGANVGTVNQNTTHTSAGTYSDSWSFTGGPNYNDIPATTITDTINKADPAISVVGYTVTYDGNSHPAMGTAKGVLGESLGGLNLTGTAHINAGTYSDSWSFADSTGNYNNASGSVNDSISKATPSVNVTPYSVTYDGNVHTAAGSATGVKSENLSGLDLSGTSHSNAGTFTDAWTFTDSTGNYNNASGSVSDAIAKANANISVTPYNVTYDGSAHTASGSATGVGGAALTGLTLSGTTHTHAGVYADTWTFTDTTGNYNDATGSVSDTIGKANVTVSVTGYKVIFDGSSHSATGSITGVGDAALAGLDLSGTAHTNAGTYSDTWTFTDGTGDYNNASGTVSDVIQQANANITVTPYNVIYDTNAHTATATATGVGGVDLSVDLSLAGTTHSNAGNYTSDPWTFHDPGGNYADAGGTVGDVIQKANQAALTLNAGTPLVYSKNETLSTSGGTTNLTPTYNLISGSCTVAGNLLTADSGTGSCVLTATMPGNSNYNDVTSGPVTVTLAKANQGTLTLIAPSTLVYGAAQSLSTSGGTTGLTPAYNLVPGSCTVAGNLLTANSGTGSCVVAATMPGNSNYNDVTSSSATVTLAKANVTVTFNSVGPFTFDGGQHAPGYVVNGVNHEVLTSSATVSYSGASGTTYSNAAPPSNPGSYVQTVAFAGSSNYNALNPSATQAFAITYGFSGLGAPYAPPPTTFNVTRTMPLVWQYTNANGAAVNSAAANPQVQISGPYTCGGVDNANDITVNSAGASGYQYNSTTSTWQFNWQVKGNAPGCYNIYIISGQTGQMTGPFPIQVVSH